GMLFLLPQATILPPSSLPCPSSPLKTVPKHAFCLGGRTPAVSCRARTTPACHQATIGAVGSTALFGADLGQPPSWLSYEPTALERGYDYATPTPVSPVLADAVGTARGRRSGGTGCSAVLAFTNA